VASWIAAALLLAAGTVALVRFGSATSFAPSAFHTAAGGMGTLAYFGTLSFALVGLELAPIMGAEIKDPVRSLPRATIFSAVVIAALYILGTVAILVALPPALVSPISGALGAVQAVADHVGWPVLGAVVAALVAISVLGGVSAWLGGAARLPLAVGLDRFLPPSMARLHPKYGTPHVAILFQTALTSGFIIASQAGSTVREAYLVMLDMTIVLNFIPFIYLFLALPLLRPAHDEPQVVRVPGGKRILWLVAILGLGATAVTLLTAVIPPPDVTSGWVFELKMWGGLILFSSIGYGIYRSYRAAASQ
jgi:amino acid transporter